jgi:hypothetical protein
MFFDQHPQHCNGHVVCPACGYPTLLERSSLESCILCHWVDDGHDDPQAHYRNGGPNDSTLNRARENFEQTCSVWSFDEKDDFTVSNQLQLFDHRIIQQKIQWRKCYDSLLELITPEAISHCWIEINQYSKEHSALRSLVEHSA